MNDANNVRITTTLTLWTHCQGQLQSVRNPSANTLIHNWLQSDCFRFLSGQDAMAASCYKYQYSDDNAGKTREEHCCLYWLTGQEKSKKSSKYKQIEKSRICCENNKSKTIWFSNAIDSEIDLRLQGITCNPSHKKSFICSVGKIDLNCFSTDRLSIAHLHLMGTFAFS